MSFFTNLLDPSGCNPDGSIGQNPLTSLVEKSFEFFPSASPGSDQQVSSNEQFHLQHHHHQYQQYQQQERNPHFQYLETTPSPMMIQNTIMNYPPHNTMAMMMMPQSYPYYPIHPPQQYLQSPHHQQPFHSPLMTAQAPGQCLSSTEQIDYQERNEEENTATASNPDDKYAKMQEMIYLANKELNSTNWTILDEDEQREAQREEIMPSKEGYQQAWHNLERKLVSGELSNQQLKQYHYEEANPFLSHVTDSTDSLTALYEDALLDYQRGEVNRALLKLEAIVQQERGKELPEVWRLMGFCHTENDDEWKAIYSFEKSVDYDPYHLSTLLALGTCYVNELDSIKALETLRTWVTNNPKFVGLEVVQDEYSDGTLMDEVMQLILTVAAHSPNDGEVQQLLGVLYNISLDYDSAIDCFEKVLQKCPNDYNILNKLGATLANSNRSSQALPYYAQALGQRPKFVRGWRNLGIAHANTNDYEPAAKAYIQALHLSPAAKHIWSYLRVVLTCMERLDLVELSTSENIQEIAKLLNVELI